MQVANRLFGNADWELSLFRHHPGIIKVRDKLNRTEKTRQVFGRDPDTDDDLAHPVGRERPKQKVVR